MTDLAAFTQFLIKSGRSEIKMRFSEIEERLNKNMPTSARKYPE
jgi:hypothetical protein